MEKLKYHLELMKELAKGVDAYIFGVRQQIHEIEEVIFNMEDEPFQGDQHSQLKEEIAKIFSDLSRLKD